MAANQVEIVLKAVDQASKQLREATDGLKALERQGNQANASMKRTAADLDRQLRQLGTSMTKVGRDLSMRLTAPIVGFGVATLKVAGDFQSSMNRVVALSGAAGDELDALTAKARELGGTTQFSASQAADAMGYMAMAGMRTDEILGSMESTLRLAAAAQLDMGSAADIVTNVLSGYGMELEQLDHAVDVLTKSFTSANTDLSQLAEAMKYAGPVASSAGVQFEEAAAAIGLMGNAGIQGSMAGTSLRGAITRLLSPTERAQSVLNELGVTVTDTNGRLLPFADIVEQLGPHADNTAAFMDIFGQRAGPAMAALVSRGSDALRELTAELENSGGTAERIADAQMEGLNGALSDVASAAEAVGIAIAQSGLIEWAERLARSTAELLRRVSEANPTLLRWGTIIAGVAAAIGPLLIAIGSVIRILPALRAGLVAVRGVMLTLRTPLLVAAAAAIALKVAWDRNLLGIQDTTRRVVEWLGPAFDNVSRFGGSLIENWETVSWGWSMLLEAMGRVAENAGSAIRAAFDVMSLRVQRAFAGMFRTIESGMQAVVNFILDSVNALVDGINRSFGWLGVELAGVERVTLDAWEGITDSIEDGLAQAQQRSADAALGISIALGNIRTVTSSVVDVIVRGMNDAGSGLEPLAEAAEGVGMTISEVKDLLIGGFDELTDVVDGSTAAVEALRKALEELAPAGPRVGALGQSIGAPANVQAMIDSRVAGRQLEASGRIPTPRMGVPTPGVTLPGVDDEVYARPLAVRMLDAAAAAAEASLGPIGAPSVTVNAAPDAAHMQRVLELELARREELVERLTTVSATDGPISVLGKNLLNLAIDSVPGVKAAFDGFVQGGPLGALAAIFTDLLGRSQGFRDLLDAVNKLLEPLIDIVGQAAAAFIPLVEALQPLVDIIVRLLQPAMSLLGWLLGGLARIVDGIVDVFVGIYNFLLGWLFGRIKRGGSAPSGDELREDEPRPAPVVGVTPSPSTPSSVSFGSTPAAVQLAVATPLLDAASTMLDGATMLHAAGTKFEAAVDLLEAALQRFARDGISVDARVTLPQGTARAASTAALR